MHCYRADRVVLLSCYLEKAFFKTLTTFFLVAALFFVATTASAANVYWSATSGDWSDATCWGGTVPTSSDSASVNNGGTVSITLPGETCRDLTLGLAAGNSGTITLVDGASLTSTSEHFGRTGTGVFLQTGGTNAISAGLYLAAASGGTGIYDLSTSGVLSALNEFVGYNGTGFFYQSGGENTTNHLSLGAGGQYFLSGGTLNVAGGFANKGVFDFAGTGEIVVSAASIFDLSGGTILNAGGKNLSLPSGSLVLVSAGYDPASTFGSYANAGMTHVVGSTLTVASDQGFGGVGDINDLVVCSGTIAATSGCGINLNKGLILFGGGNVNLGTGILTVEDSISCLTGGTLTLTNQYVGKNINGSFTQTGGTSIYSSGLYLGYNSGSTGTYSLNDGLLSRKSSIGGSTYIGYSGSGLFRQTGGTNSVVSISLGHNLGANGTYQLSGSAKINCGFETIGNSGTGSFIQSGGSNVAGHLYLGYQTGSTGTYTLSGNSYIQALNEYLGGGWSSSSGGVGTFNQIGGTNTISGYLFLGYYSTATGFYNFQSGFLSTVNESIGGGGTGSFIQTGGTHTVSSTLEVGYGVLGSYTLTNGYLSGNTEYVGDGYSSGSSLSYFLQTGGTNSATSLYVQNASHYTLGGSGVLTASGLYVQNEALYTLADSGTLSATNEYVNSKFSQSGGTNSVASTLYVGYTTGYTTGYTGTYTLSDGALTVAKSGSIQVGGNGTGRLEWLGGTLSTPKLTVGGSGTLAMGFDFNVGSLVGGTLFNGTSFTSSSGTLEIVNGAAATQGGTTSLALGNLMLGTPLGDGNFTLADTAKLSATNEYDGYSTNGSFTQSGGSNGASTALYLGYNAGTSGDYTLNSGTLSALSVYVGYSGSGSFTQNGGDNTPPSSASLYLGYNTTATGVFTQNAGRMGYYSLKYIGYNGNGSYVQKGGANAIGTRLYLGYNAGSTGTYSMDDDCRMSGGTEYVGYGGFGSFTQSGGSHGAGSLYLGYLFTAQGNYLLEGTSILSATNVYVGNPGRGDFTQTGGSHSISSSLYLGNYSQSTGTYTMSGSAYLSAGSEYIGYNGVGTFTQKGGSNVLSSIFILGYNSTGTGTYNLEGGTLRLKYLTKGSGTPQFNFGGGTLQASGKFLTPLDMTLTGTGGNAKIDTAGYNVSLYGALSGSGGLEKQGAGTLILSGKNTYTGETTVSAGILQITQAFTNGGKISVADGAGIVFGTPQITSTAPEGTAGWSSSGTQGEIVAVPEPGTWALLAASFLGFAVAVRRKRV